MIPASYMFKDIYHQQWEQKASDSALTGGTSSTDGLITPTKLLFQAMLHRSKPGRAYFGVHAYD